MLPQTATDQNGVPKTVAVPVQFAFVIGLPVTLPSKPLSTIAF
jgi:hypothetical protein